MERLSLNLMVAAKMAKPDRHRPRNHLVRQTTLRLVEAYEKATGTSFPKSRLRGGKACHMFVRAAARMLLNVEPETAEGALKSVLEWQNRTATARKQEKTTRKPRVLIS